MWGSRRAIRCQWQRIAKRKGRGKGSYCMASFCRSDAMGARPEAALSQAFLVLGALPLATVGLPNPKGLG